MSQFETSAEIQTVFGKGRGDRQQHDINYCHPLSYRRYHYRWSVKHISVQQESRQVHTDHTDHHHTQSDKQYSCPASLSILIVYQLPESQSIAVSDVNEQEDGKDVLFSFSRLYK